MKEFTITVHDEDVIQKLESLSRKKGEYVTRLIKENIRMELLERKVERLEKDGKG